jgi:hypothetical protein
MVAEAVVAVMAMGAATDKPLKLIVSVCSGTGRSLPVPVNKHDSNVFRWSSVTQKAGELINNASP